MFAEIIIDSSNSFIDRTYDYKIPENLNVKLGNRVIVSFGKQQIQGFVVLYMSRQERQVPSEQHHGEVAELV